MPNCQRRQDKDRSGGPYLGSGAKRKLLGNIGGTSKNSVGRRARREQGTVRAHRAIRRRKTYLQRNVRRDKSARWSLTSMFSHIFPTFLIFSIKNLYNYPQNLNLTGNAWRRSKWNQQLVGRQCSIANLNDPPNPKRSMKILSTCDHLWPATDRFNIFLQLPQFRGLLAPNFIVLVPKELPKKKTERDEMTDTIALCSLIIKQNENIINRN